MTQRVNSELYLLDKVSPLFPLARLTGVLPYSDELNFSEKWFKYSLLSITTIVASVNAFRAVYLIYSSNNFLNEGFNTILYIFQSSLNDICLITHLIQLIFRRNILKKVFKQLKSFDTIWSTYTSVFSKKLTGFGLLWVALSQAAILITDSTTYEKLVRVTYSTTYITFYTIVMTFCCLLELVRNHFITLTKEIKPIDTQLHRQISMHYSLIQLAYNINKLFSLQLLITCMRCSINFICQMFFFLQFLRNNDWAVDMVLALTFLIGDCIMELIILFCIAASCSETSAKDSPQISQIKGKINHRTLSFQNGLQLYVTLNKSIEFSASGFFSIGYPLVTSVLAAATTYLVILVQFSMVPDSSKKFNQTAEVLIPKLNYTN
ncbi:hypothetical protein O3M35_009026 [Rhynocoris fuscipes]|uniref:Gustatory receptor n=1 Tax=Rhynocoris fuscipes TaxID=488301 RepID=A0AAW1D460_9HEMI